MMTPKTDTRTQLLTAPPFQLMLSLSLPAIIGMVVVGLYSFMDRVFVGQLIDQVAMGAVSVSYPFTLINSGISTLIGVGSASVLSRAVGKKDQGTIDKIMGNLIALNLILGVIVTVLGMIFTRPILTLSGAEGAILNNAERYLRIIFAGSLFVNFAQSSNMIMRGEGLLKQAMIYSGGSAILNIILDPILISVLEPHGMGIEGAAYATVIAQIVYAAAMLRHFRSKSKNVRIHGIRVEKSLIPEIFGVGFCLKIEWGFIPSNCLHLLALKIASVALAGTACWLALTGVLELPMMLMICFFSFGIFAGLEPISDSAHVLSVINNAMDQLDALRENHFIDQDGRDIPLERFDIAFRHVEFGYDARTVLKDVSFTIPQNTSTAIVGPSGSGKTTICSLTARFYDVTSGSVTVGGHDVREFTCDSLLKHISMVFQNVYLFHDTIRANICFGRPDATEEEMISAAKKARCHDFIMALPDGYDTIVGEGGGSLSGGEKQRISIGTMLRTPRK